MLYCLSLDANWQPVTMQLTMPTVIALSCLSISYILGTSPTPYWVLQWSLYFKTTHGTKKMWYYIAGGLKIKVISHRKLPFGTKSSGLIIKGGLKIEDCKIEGLLYMY